MLKSLALLALLIVTNSAFAQKYFEGELTVTQTSFKEATPEKATIKVLLSPARIKIEGGDKKVDVKMLGADDVSSVLIRLDNEDFVMFSADMGNTALKITKLDIENMVNMVKNMSRQFGNQQGQPVKPEPTIDVNKTKESKKIAGYSAVRHIVTSSDAPNEETHVWISEELNVNLGMLSDDWEFLGSISTGSNKWLKNGHFPLLVQTFKQGKITNSIEVASIKKAKIDADKLDVPDEIQLLSFQDMIMKKMMGN